MNVFAKNEKANLTKAERNEIKELLPRLAAGYQRRTESRKPSAGGRILASLREAVDWAEGKDVPVRITTVEVPAIDVRPARKRLGLTQEAFAAKFGFQPATLRNWEQGRTRWDGPAGVARRDRSPSGGC